jgi:hypothetical protein
MYLPELVYCLGLIRLAVYVQLDSQRDYTSEDFHSPGALNKYSFEI